MMKAMSTLKQFSDKERDYHAYQARQNYLREQICIQRERDEALIDKEAALADKEAALADKEVAVADTEAALRLIKEKDAELERLKALLAKNNLH